MAGTRAIQALDRAVVTYRVHRYAVDADAPSYGEAVAAALGVPPDRLFKTLVARVDGEPCAAVVPVSTRLSLKRLAAARGGKRAEMTDPADAERLTGYVTGGISPFGQRRRLPAVVDASALGHDTVYVSGGQRGIQVEVAPAVLVELTGAELADLSS